MTQGDPGARPAVAVGVAIALLCAGGVGVSLSPLDDLVKPLMGVLAVCAVAAELTAARYAGQLSLSGAFVATIVAIGFLGAAPAFAIPLISFVATWLVERYRWQALLIN